MSARAQRPDLLFLAQRLPYPPDKGDKIRAYHELRYLAQWYNVHLGCVVDDPADLEHIETIRPICQDLHVARISRRLSHLTCLRGLLSGEGLSVTYFRDKGLTTWVRHVLQNVRPDVTFVYSSNMAPYVLDLLDPSLRVVDLVDVDSAKWQAMTEATKSPWRLVYHRERRMIAELEARIARECDLSTFVSDAEADLFTRQHPALAHRIRGVSNGVDHRYFDPVLDFPPLYDTARPNYVFTGTMDYPPNADAVTWFAAEILPRIQQTLPAAQFHIVGGNPGRPVQQLARLNGVFVTGRVADVRPYIAHATASVAPMRIARGIQNKVLEAMAMAKAVVLTSGALEGIEADPRTEIVLADTTETFAAACCHMATTLLGDAIGVAARRRIIRDYDWDVTLRRFDDFLRPALPPKPAPQPSESHCL